MARYVIDARTLLHVLESGRSVALAHQLVAPASIRSQVMDPPSDLSAEVETSADGIVEIADVHVL